MNIIDLVFIVILVILLVLFVSLVFMKIHEHSAKIKETKNFYILFEGDLVKAEIIKEKTEELIFKFDYKNENYIFSKTDDKFYQLKGPRNWTKIRDYDV